MLAFPRLVYVFFPSVFGKMEVNKTAFWTRFLTLEALNHPFSGMMSEQFTQLYKTMENKKTPHTTTEWQVNDAQRLTVEIVTFLVFCCQPCAAFIN